MSNRDDRNEFAAVFVVLYLIALAIAAYVVIVALCFTLVLTIGCIAAWKEPKDFEKATIFPEEARAFILRGVFGAFMGALIGALGIHKYGWKIEPQWIWAFAVGGYVIASTGIQAMMSPEQADGSPDFFPKRPIPISADEPLGPTINITPVSAPPEIEAEPFFFADWDDGEERT